MTGSDVLRVACGELGIKEQPANSNRVKYNAWYYGKDVSGSSYPWCMAFVQWCYHSYDMLRLIVIGLRFTRHAR